MVRPPIESSPFTEAFKAGGGLVAPFPAAGSAASSAAAAWTNEINNENRPINLRRDIVSDGVGRRSGIIETHRDERARHAGGLFGRVKEVQIETEIAHGRIVIPARILPLTGCLGAGKKAD